MTTASPPLYPSVLWMIDPGGEGGGGSRCHAMGRRARLASPCDGGGGRFVRCAGAAPRPAQRRFRPLVTMRQQHRPIRALQNRGPVRRCRGTAQRRARPSRRSEEHTSELQSLMRISYAVFCLKKKKYEQMKHHKIVI